MRRFLALFVLAALFAVPTVAMAKGKDSAPGQQKVKEAKPAGGDETAEVEGEEPERTPEERAAAKEARAAAKEARAAARAAHKANHIPTGRAQEVLAAKLASGRFSAEANWVFYRILTKMQEKHGAALALPAAPPEPPAGGTDADGD